MPVKFFLVLKPFLISLSFSIPSQLLSKISTSRLSWVFRFLKFRSRGPNRNRNSGSVGIPLRSAGIKSIPAGINVAFLTLIGTVIPPESGMLPEYFALYGFKDTVGTVTLFLLRRTRAGN